MPDIKTGIKPLPLTPVLLVRHSENSLQLRPVSWVVISDDPSAAMWSTLFYTNATPQTGRRPFAWVIQLLIVFLKDENVFLEDHPSQVVM